MSQAQPMSTRGSQMSGSNGGSSQALATMNLLEALRSYSDTSSPQDTKALISYLQAVPATNAGNSQNKPTPLHLAIRCARVSAVPLILDHRPTDLNARDASGATPLHLACALGRAEVVAVLLSQPEVDDTIKDDEGKTCLERAKSGDVARLIQTSRNQFNQTYLELLAAYTNGGPVDPLMNWVKRNRSRCIDYTTKVPPGVKGTTILHEAAKRKDLKLLELCIARGADVLARDGRGKLPMDVAKDSETKAWFKQAMSKEGAALKANPGSSISDMSAFEPSGLPVRKGYLEKWTNMAKGYKQRWFVLSNGQLTYYRHQDEEGKASRGTIMLNQARVTGLSEDKMKFEISSNIAKFKFYCKADHPLEAVRWVEDLKMHIEGASPTSSSKHSTSASVSSLNIPRPSSSSSATSPYMPDDVALPSTSAGSSMTPTPAGSQLDLTQANKRHSKLGQIKNRALGRPSSNANLAATHTQSGADLTVPQRVSSTAPSLNESVVSVGHPSMAGEDTDNASLYTFAGELEEGARPPHEENFSLLATSAKAQVEASESLVDSIEASSDVKAALKQGLKRLTIMMDEYADQVADRENWFQRRYEREAQTRRLWEENMHQVAAQHEELEQELQRTAAKGSRRKKELKEVRMELLNSPTKTIMSDSNTVIPDGDGSPQAKSQPLLGHPILNETTPNIATAVTPTVVSARAAPEPDSSSDDEDDEFFEAVESGALPVKVETPIQNTEPHTWPKDFAVEQLKIDSMNAYKTLRDRLPITNDDRPSVSLWGILKNSIGKDLTKISFPVSFNEPTSMLERMAEDMEFSECLDAAAAAQDSTTRIAYVAAFAMSNYSSTIGRIAKPFNPLLGETFEYARMDKLYRYMSEQVSHHPPISACICESPNWKYYGEVDARNKFLGKSFEIRPTGIAHCDLRLPQELGPNYPKDVRGKALEHYSWKKVTTSVSNFIMGSPIIDHYGDMTITNHRTGDKCVLTFKPRGWRGSNAREIKGEVFDAQGRKVWDIAGRWSTQLVARRAGSASGDLQPDAEVPKQDEYLLLWKNSEKPPNSPFNLTPYAITLNHKSPELLPWLPSTDVRYRPDLHAFESGHFEQANDLKTGLETLQRKTRQQRETGELPPHAPRWFSRATDPDTGEGYWEPAKVNGTDLAYFEERFRVGTAKQNGDANAQWENVDHIFGDYELL